MGRIWAALVLISAMLSLISGNSGAAAQALLDSGHRAVTLLMTLLATMTLWSGLMEILVATGDVTRLGRMFRRLLKPLFPGLEDDAGWNAISMNLSANLLGLGNAATPAGIEAAKRLSALGRNGLSALAMLLVLDNTSLQLIPTTVITLRQAAGAKNPADIWGMTLLVSGITMAAAVSMMYLIQRGGRSHERLERERGSGRRGVHIAAGVDDGR